MNQLQKKTVKSARKVMPTVFWNARGIFHIDYLSSKQTINGDYYAALLDRFNNILKKKAKKKVLFHQDNARIHTCPAPMAKFNEFHYEVLPHPAYSPDLAPYDYFLFLNLKKFRGKRFTTREQLIVETEAYFLVGFSSRSYYGITNLSLSSLRCTFHHLQKF